MSQNLQNFAKFQEFQLDNLVDFKKCCKTRILLQKSVPIQPKMSNNLPKFAKNWHCVGNGQGRWGPQTSAGAQVWQATPVSNLLFCRFSGGNNTKMKKHRRARQNDILRDLHNHLIEFSEIILCADLWTDVCRFSRFLLRRSNQPSQSRA